MNATTISEKSSNIELSSIESETAQPDMTRVTKVIRSGGTETHIRSVTYHNAALLENQRASVTNPQHHNRYAH